ncbi:MAG TPA: hypothetical protein VHM31_14535 [Polyangia bacterium]|nr:hypothetical protein [Polyangia bacterium]
MTLQLTDDLRAILISTAQLLDATRTRYATIGGVAVQLHLRTPRPTDNLDVAVESYADIPRSPLRAAGFVYGRRNAHSDAWLAPRVASGHPKINVRFVAGTPELAAAISDATTVAVNGYDLKVATPEDLIALALAAAEDPYRKPAKRRRDVSDAIQLLEQHPAGALPALRARLARLVQQLP